MKRYFSLLITAALFSFAACDDGNKDDGAISIDSASKTQTLAADATQASVTFTASESWTLSLAATAATRATAPITWVEASKYSGDAGNNTVTLTFQSNPNEAARAVNVTIKVGTSTETARITQPGTTGGGNVTAEKLTVTATVSTQNTGTTNVTHVKAAAWLDEDDSTEQVIAVADYNNNTNSFTIDLPAEYPSSMLVLVKDGIGVTGATISSSTAKMGMVSLFGFSNGSTTWSESGLIDEFWYGTADEYEGGYFFFTEDVTITYNGTDETFDISAKKGWNMLYDYGIDDMHYVSSTKPSGDFRWSFGYHDAETGEDKE